MELFELEKSPVQGWFYGLRDELQRFVFNRSDEAFAAGDAARDAISNIDELKIRQENMRTAFIQAIGGLLPSDTPLNARVVGTVECDGFKIEKVIFESRPKTFVTANLYIPNSIVSPRGAVLFLCGHAEESKHWPEYQIVCRYLTSAGLVVLAQDPLGQGERKSYYEPGFGETVRWGTQEHEYAGSQCRALGDSLARYFIHDAMRGMDYLCSRPEVDPSRIGVTGNSGGGVQTALMMICDPRTAAAAPTTFIMNRQTYMTSGGSQDAEQIWPRMTALGYDHEDILLMMCPRPVRVNAVKYDFFPIEGARRTVERCRRFWEMFGREDCMDMVEDASTHNYTRPLANAAAEFFSQHLLGNRVSPDDEKIQSIEPSALWCTKSGQVRGEIEGAEAVYDENLRRLAELETARSAMPDNKRKERAVEWLHERVFASRKPTNLNIKLYLDEMSHDLVAQKSLWWSQVGIHSHAWVFRDYRFIGKDIPVTVAIWDEGMVCLQDHAMWLRETCASGRAVMVLDTSGVGYSEPNPLDYIKNPRADYGAIHHFVDDLDWLDDSLAAMRIYDVIRSLDAIEVHPGLTSDDIRMYAFGRQGVYAQFAALLEKRIRSVEVVSGMGSYASWVGARHYDWFDIKSIVIPGLLKYMDLPDVERWRMSQSENQS